MASGGIAFRFARAPNQRTRGTPYQFALQAQMRWQQALMKKTLVVLIHVCPQETGLYRFLIRVMSEEIDIDSVQLPGSPTNCKTRSLNRYFIIFSQ